MPQSKWFQYYARELDTVELNSPFYHFPKISTAKSWHRSSPENFIYTLKVNRQITHIKKFKNVKRLINDFYIIGDSLEEKMGYFLFQLPPSLHFNNQKLREIITQLNLEKRNAIEFRHISWFNEEVYDEFRKNGIVFCIVSSPKLPEDFIKTSDDIYIRYHGKQSWYASKYTLVEIKDWADKIKKSKAESVWAYFNNDANAYAPKNALTLKKLLK